MFAAQLHSPPSLLAKTPIISNTLQNECTKVQNPRRHACVNPWKRTHYLNTNTTCANFESATLFKCTLMTCRGKYTDFSQKTENKEKEACCLTLKVVFSLLLAFLGPLECSAVEKVRRMLLQYPCRMWRVSKWRCNFWMERFQRKPHKYLGLRSSLSMWQYFQDDQTLKRWDLT